MDYSEDLHYQYPLSGMYAGNVLAGHSSLCEGRNESAEAWLGVKSTHLASRVRREICLDCRWDKFMLQRGLVQTN